MISQIRIDRNVLKTLAMLPVKRRHYAGSIIDSLKNNPFPKAARKLDKDLYRICSEDCRILYMVIRRKILICLFYIGSGKRTI